VVKDNVMPDRHARETSSGTRADRAIRLSTAGAVLTVAGVAAYISYWHAYAVVLEYGETGITARLEPATIDGLVYACSMVMLYAARHQRPVPGLARWLLALGIAATLAANMAQGWAHGPFGAIVAAWPAASLVGSYELLVWIMRTSSAISPASVTSEGLAGEPADQAGAGRTKADGPGAGPADQGSGPLADHADHGEDVDAAAVSAYLASVKAGKPLSERALASSFGKTSRRWARKQMTQARALHAGAAA
jgi:hypothetical protein